MVEPRTLNSGTRALIVIAVDSLLMPPDHVGHGPTGGDEGEDMFAVGRDDIKDIGGFGVEHALERGAEIAFVHDALTGHVEGIADADVVGIDLRAILRIAEVGMA